MRLTSVIGLGLMLLGEHASAAVGSAFVNTASFWKNHSVVFGEIESVERLDPRTKRTHHILFRPKATLSGTFDPGLHPALHFNLSAGGGNNVIPIEPLRSGQKVIVCLLKLENSFEVSIQSISFMPDGVRTIVAVSGLADPKVEQTLAKIQIVRGKDDVKAPGFWEHHSVVLGEIESVEFMPEDQRSKGTHRLVFQPKKTLSGPFDPKDHPKLDVDLYAGWYIGPFRQRPRAGQKVMLLLQKQKASYRVLPYDYSFMPEGAAFVVLPSYDDPKVEKTMSAIKELRKGK